LLILENQIFVPSDLEELYQLYSRDIDEGQLIHDLKSLIDITLNDFFLMKNLFFRSFTTFTEWWKWKIIKSINITISFSNC
jgi:hypothetical protein